MKTRIWIALAMVILLGIILGTSCAPAETPLFNMVAIETVENYSYIPLSYLARNYDIKGNYDINPNVVLDPLAAFERAYPKLEIIFWQIVTRYTYGDITRAIRVTHRPKN